MATFLLKTEPSEYSFDDLRREGRCVWTGVRNAAALIHLRRVRRGDEILIYHTSSQRAIVGLARAASDPYEDPARPGKTPQGEPKSAVVDLLPVRAAGRPLTLADMKQDPAFSGFELLTHARLSVMPVPAPVAARARALAGL